MPTSPSTAPVEVVVDSRARVRLAAISAECAADIRAKFEHEYRDENGPVAEHTWREEDGWLSVPRAGLRRMRNEINRRGIGTVADRRHDGDFAQLDTQWGNAEMAHRRELWAYQVPVVTAAFERQNCIVRAPTGSGKTTMAAALAARIGRPTIVIVPNGTLFDQWVARVADELAPMRDPKLVGRWGDGERFLAPVTIAMQQTLARGISQRLYDAFGAVICDELQAFAAPTFFAAVDGWPARWRIGFSADHTRRDGREYMVHDLFGETAGNVTEDEVLASGKVVEVEVRLVPTAFDAPGYRQAMIGRNMFAKRAAYRRLVDSMAANAARNQLIRDIVDAEVAAGEQVMVFVERREHAMQLAAQLNAEGIKSGAMLGGAKADKKQFEQTREGIAAGTTKVAVGTEKAIGAGLDLPSVARGVLSAPRSNNRQQLGQMKGRLCRACAATGKTEGVLYVLWDREIYGRKALENFVKWFKRVKVREADGSWTDGREYLGGMKRGISSKDLSETVTIDDLVED